jgi:hypothetical protein
MHVKWSAFKPWRILVKCCNFGFKFLWIRWLTSIRLERSPQSRSMQHKNKRHPNCCLSKVTKLRSISSWFRISRLVPLPCTDVTIENRNDIQDHQHECLVVSKIKIGETRLPTTQEFKCSNVSDSFFHVKWSTCLVKPPPPEYSNLQIPSSSTTEK